MLFYLCLGTLVSESAIRLTPSIAHMKGSLWSTNTNPHHDWIAELGFSVHGSGKHGGNGLAFWYTHEPGVPLSLLMDEAKAEEDRSGSHLGQAFGASERWKGLGLFFDTHGHQRDMPYIYAIINDGTMDLSKLNNAVSVQLGGCFRDFRNKGTVKARIEFLKGHLTVDLDINDGSGYKTCITKDRVELTSGYYFGVSASTGGEFADDHDLHELDVYNLDSHEKHSAKPAHHLSHQEEKHLEEIKAKVDKARHEHEEELEHGDSGVSDEVKTEMGRIEGTLHKILENVYHLQDQMDGKPAAHHTSSAFETDRGASHDSSELKAIAEKVDKLYEETGEIFDLVKDIASYISHVGTKESEKDQDHIAHQLAELHETINKRQIGSGDGSSGGSGWLSNILIFLMGQALIVAVYAWFKNRKQDEFKKFI